MKIGVYAGTFDPITNGHLDVIKRASKLFDKLYVTIFINPDKKTLFSVEERLKLMRESTKDMENIVVDSSNELAVEYAKRVGAHFLVRGLRATQDYDYESMMAYTNQYLDSDIETIFLMTKLSYCFISSSHVKEIASHHYSIKELVPECVNKALIQKYGEKK